MPTLYDNVANALALVVDGASHAISIDTTGATTEANEATYGDGKGVWLLIDLADSYAGTFTVDLNVTVTSGAILPYLDFYSVNSSFNSSSPDFQALDTGTIHWIGTDTINNRGYYGDGTAAPGSLSLGFNVTNTSLYAWGGRQASNGNRYYIWVGDWTDTNAGVLNITYQVNTPAPPPANDNLASRIYLGESAGGCIDGTTDGATAESGETDPASGFPATHSVWYRWQSPRAATYRFWIESSDPNMADGIMAIYASNSELSDPSTLGAADFQGDNEIGTQPQCDVVTTAEFDKYYIQIDTRNSGGTFKLRWVKVVGTPPSNDDFANAISLTGASGSQSGSLTNATAECGEPYDAYNGPGYGPYGSVWYKIVVGASSTFALTLTALAIDNSVISYDIWTGSSLATLVNFTRDPLGSGNTDSEDFTPGTYYLRFADGYYTPDGGGTFSFDWALTAVTPPANDNFVNAIGISAPGSGTISQNNGGATAETGEPNGTTSGSGTTYTSWYKFTIAASGELTLSYTSGPGKVYVYQGTTLTALTRQGSSLGVSAGHPYEVFYLGPGTYYLQFVTYAWSPNLVVNWTIALAKTSTTGNVTATAIGNYTRIDAFPNGVLSRGIWIRFLMHRVSGDFIHLGANTDSSGNQNNDLTICRLVANDGTTVQEIVQIRGSINGNNEIYTSLAPTSLAGSTFIDGVLVQTSTGRLVGSLSGSQDYMLIELHVDSGYFGNNSRYLDVGMISGPTLSGWQLVFSNIAITDDPMLGPYGSPDSTSKDLGYFAGWTDGAFHVSGPAPPVNSSPPAGGPSYALDLVHDATNTFSVQSYGIQGLYSVAFPIYVVAYPNVEIALITPPYASYPGYGTVTLNNTGVLRIRPTGGSPGTVVGSLSSGAWHDVELIIDARTNTGTAKLVVDGVTLATIPTFAPIFTGAIATAFSIGFNGLTTNPTSGEILVGPIATGRTAKSVPLGKVTAEKIVVNGIGTHRLPSDMNPAVQITTFAEKREIIFGGTAITTGGWTALFANYEAGAISGTNSGHDAVFTGTPETSMTAYAPDADRFGVKMQDGFEWTDKTIVFFDFWCTGPAGKVVNIDGPASFAENYATHAAATMTGSPVHMTGWSNPQQYGYTSHKRFSINFPPGGDVYTVTDFKVYLSPSILPIYATSSDAGATDILLTLTDATSAGILADSSDSTVVMLDRQGSWSGFEQTDDQLGVPGFGPGSSHFVWEATQFARRYYLEYGLANPTVSPNGVKLLARTGGYGTYMNSTRVAGDSRFGLSDGTSEKSIGILNNSAIAGGELLIPEPPNPSTRWTQAKLTSALLRMGYFDGVGGDFHELGVHTIGANSDRNYRPGPNGGVVAYAQLEAIRLIPLVAVGPIASYSIVSLR